MRNSIAPRTHKLFGQNQKVILLEGLGSGHCLNARLPVFRRVGRLILLAIFCTVRAVGAQQASIVSPEEMQLATEFASARANPAKLITTAGFVRSASQGWNVLHVGWSVNHRVLQLRGKQFFSGFGSHADATIEYELPAGAKRLTGICGIDDTDEARQNPHPVVFSVMVGGRDVWRGKPQSALDEPGVFDVDTTGAQTVTLIARGGADLTYTPADFVELHLTLADGKVTELGQRTPFERTDGSGFSFSYGGKPSSDFLSSWKVDQQQLPETINYFSFKITRSDPATGLQCTQVFKRYKHYPVVEWTVTFQNNGRQDSPILENIRSLDLSLAASDHLQLHHHTGDYAADDSYEPHLTELLAGSDLRFAPNGGRPTDKAWPYFNLENADEKTGIITVVGWPGQWSAEFARSASSPQLLHIQAGQELTHFLLHPGEQARTPISVLMFYQGESVRSQNIWRRWMLEENIPHPAGELPPWVNAASLGLHQSERSEIDGINLFAAEAADLNYWWMDAGWYPCTNWWDGVGSWFPDPARFPHEVKAVSDVAHAHHQKLILWLEPERAVPGSDLYKYHPEYLLGKEGADKLFNLGNAAAWKWMVNHVDELINTQGVDLYRQDFNQEALGFWRANDATDRQGMTEMRHIEGYLAFWDELHRRHPELLIDTCASGGRRLDLETLRRSVPLWRSDDSNNPEHNQCQTYGLASWVPMFGSGTGCDSAYSIRSEMLPFFTLGLCSDPTVPMNWNLYRTESDHWRKIRQDLIGDYYPLLPYTRDMQNCIAWQYNRTDLGTGVLQVFRRPNSPFESARFDLHGLIPSAKYVVTDLDRPELSAMFSGHELMEKGIEVQMPSAPAAVLVTYKTNR